MLPNQEIYLRALGKRGHAATIIDGQLRYVPALTPHLQRQADAAAETIRAEITRRWNDADAEMDSLTQSGLSDADALALCTYEARKPSQRQPPPNPAPSAESNSTGGSPARQTRSPGSATPATSRKTT